MTRDWILALHVISVICWFAALFYLPRLFVYHAQSDDKISLDRFIVMERKLYRGIATPSMVASLVFGVWLVALNPDYYADQLWFLVKTGLATLVVVYHGLCWHFLGKFRDGTNRHNHVFYRWFNEIPVLFLIGIVIMVIVRHF